MNHRPDEKGIQGRIWGGLEKVEEEADLGAEYFSIGPRASQSLSGELSAGGDWGLHGTGEQKSSS